MGDGGGLNPRTTRGWDLLWRQPHPWRSVPWWWFERAVSASTRARRWGCGPRRFNFTSTDAFSLTHTQLRPPLPLYSLSPLSLFFIAVCPPPSGCLSLSLSMSVRQSLISLCACLSVSLSLSLCACVRVCPRLVTAPPPPPAPTRRPPGPAARAHQPPFLSCRSNARRTSRSDHPYFQVNVAYHFHRDDPPPSPPPRRRGCEYVEPAQWGW